MKRARGHRIAVMLACLALTLSSCSTVKVLKEDERRLASTRIVVVNDKKFNTSSLQPYLKQTADSWNPFLYVYNWETGKGKGWDKFVHTIGRAPVVYDSTLVDSSVASIKEHLKYIGYYDSSVDVEVDKSRYKKARIKYYVTLGKRYRINSASYDVDESSIGFYRDFMADTLMSSVKPGGYLSEEALENESARSAAALHEKGYYAFSKNFFVFEADTVSNPGQAALKIIVRNRTRNESEDVVHNLQKYRIGKVSVSYPDDVKLREKLLRNLNILESGEIYSDSKINTEYSRYSSLNYLNSVNVLLTPNESEGIVDCEINLNKGKTQGFKLGLEASLSTTGLWGVSPQLSYYHRNIFHGGEVLNLSINTNHQVMNGNRGIHSNEVTASASLIFPKFFPLPYSAYKGSEMPKTEVKMTYNYQNRPQFIRQIFSASFGYVGSVKNRFSYQVYPLSVNLVQLPFVDKNFLESLKKKSPSVLNSFENHFDLGLSGTFQYSTGNITNPKETFWYTRLRTDLSGNLMSLFNDFMQEDANGYKTIMGMPYSQYARLEWSIGRTQFLDQNNRHALAMRFLIGLGVGYGNSRTLPFEKRFFSGGANSLRGWSAKTLGPGNSPLDKEWAIPNQTGDMKLEANLEYRFKLFWKLHGAVFAEAGNVWELRKPVEDDENMYFSFRNLGQSLAASWGIGLRADLNFIVLRLDYGLRIHDPARLPGERWIRPLAWFSRDNFALHFGVGYPF